MKDFHTAVFLFIVSSAVIVLTLSAADDCDSLALAIISCEAINDACPTDCQDTVDSFHTTCSMDGATYFNSTYQDVATLLGLGLLKENDACRDVILDKAVAITETCQDWATLNLGSVIFYCGTSGVECPQFCKDMMDGLYGTCGSTDTYQTVDDDTGEITSNSIMLVEQGLRILLSDTCQGYQKTLRFHSEDSTASSGSGSGSGSMFAAIISVCVVSFIISLS